MVLDTESVCYPNSIFTVSIYDFGSPAISALDHLSSVRSSWADTHCNLKVSLIFSVVRNTYFSNTGMGYWDRRTDFRVGRLDLRAGCSSVVV